MFLGHARISNSARSLRPHRVRQDVQEAVIAAMKYPRRTQTVAITHIHALELQSPTVQGFAAAHSCVVVTVHPQEISERLLHRCSSGSFDRGFMLGAFRSFSFAALILCACHNGVLRSKHCDEHGKHIIIAH